MNIKKIITGGKRITAGALFLAIGAAPYVAPIVAPEAMPFVAGGSAVAAGLGALLVGRSKWNAWRERGIADAGKYVEWDVGPDPVADIEAVRAETEFSKHAPYDDDPTPGGCRDDIRL